MRIALDAMGGDYAPREIVRGSVDAARHMDEVTEITLVGDEKAVKAELSRCGDIPEKISVRHASQVIGMDEAPAQAVRRRKDASVSRAVDMVKKGEADACVSAGNTGAMVVASTLKLRTLEGVERPAIASVMPTQNRPFILLDAGANTDCSANLLSQFAVMGHVYSRAVFDLPDPVVGLLSIGGESIKGNDITKETFKILENARLNFKGNVEGHDLFEGETDVVVCDGFVGNVVLKTSESAALAFAHWMKDEFKRNPVRLLGVMLLKGALRAMKHRLDPETYGGALLLGVNGVCIITHGASSRRAIYHAIRVACESVHNHLNDLIVQEIRALQGDA